jgi:hypothetical protein
MEQQMRKVLVVIMVSSIAFGATGCATSAAAPFASSNSPAKRDYSAPLTSSGVSADAHIMRSEQLRSIPAGSQVGVIAGNSAGLSLFVEADLEAKGLTVRQIDIYDMLSPREQSLTDPAGEYTYINNLISALAKDSKADKDSLVASVDKLLPADTLDMENQLVTRYLELYSNLKKMVAALNVDYLVVVGPAFKELSYAMKIYDTSKFDLVYTCLFVGDVKEWRSVIGNPQKTANLSYIYKSGSEPAAFWELAFSKFAVDRIKVGGASAAAKQ